MRAWTLQPSCVPPAENRVTMCRLAGGDTDNSSPIFVVRDVPEVIAAPNRARV